MDNQALDLLPSFGIDPATAKVTRITTGHINLTFRIDLVNEAFILQRINRNVFRKPEVIAGNLRLAANHLLRNYPEYRFLSSVLTTSGAEMAWDEEEYPWRLFPFIADTFTVNEVSTPEQARDAAAGFSRLTRFLDGCNVGEFGEPIPDFHNLALRYNQFESALSGALAERISNAEETIAKAQAARHLVMEYESLLSSGTLVRRITHNDTKINNILFHRITQKPVCVIDLDTLGPGYFIYDLGDMVRTFVSPVSEEEKDLGKVAFRADIYSSLLEGYLSEVGNVLTEGERSAIPFAGKMMTSIMAYRFLADYLNGDVYYHTTYRGQNLIRARNQFRLVELLEAHL